MTIPENTDQTTWHVIHALLDGGGTNGASPEDCGRFAEEVAALFRAYAADGTRGVREAFDAIALGNPGLAALVAGGPDGDPWKVFTLADAYKPRPPTEYAVNGLFALPSVSIVYGAPGSLKSMLMADCAVCVAAGVPWLPPLPKTTGQPIITAQYPVMWVDFDNGQNRTHERFEALARARNLPESTPLFYASLPTPWLDASNGDAMDALGERMLRRDIRLMFLDNLGCVLGKADENSAEMVAILSNFRRLAELTGSAIEIIHHQRKGMSARRSGDTLRGHSSIEAALDLALLVEREDRSGVLSVTATKSRGTDVPPFGASFSFTHKPGTMELETAKFWGMVSEDLSSDYAVEQAILDNVRSSPGISKIELSKQVKEELDGVGLNRIRGIIDRMEGTGKLNRSDGQRGAKQYEASDDLPI